MIGPLPPTPQISSFHLIKKTVFISYQEILVSYITLLLSNWSFYPCLNLKLFIITMIMGKIYQSSLASNKFKVDRKHKKLGEKRRADTETKTYFTIKMA